MHEPEGLEINIGHYLEILIRQWQLILGAALICAIVAGIVSSQRPEIYRARVLIATTKIASAVSFETGIETLTEEQLGYRLSSSAARLQSYAQIVRNPAIANEVINKLGDRLDESNRDVVRLMGQVQGQVAPKSDAIEIVVRHRDPELAAAIANAWGKAYVEHVNNVYSGGGLRDSYLAIKNQTEEAGQVYEQAQDALADFMARNRVQELARQITEQQAVVDNISVARTLLVNTVVSNTMTANLTVFDEQIQNLEDRLVLAYTESRQVTHWLKSAQDMRDQVLNGGSGAANSNSLALNLLKAQVFATPNNEPNRETIPVESERAPSNINIQAIPASLTPEEMVADLNSLIRTLEARQVSLEGEIRAISQKLLENSTEVSGLSLNSVDNSSGPAIESQAAVQSFSSMNGLEEVLALNMDETDLEQRLKELENEINQLESLSALETSQELELTRARDLAWETYSTLATKQAELKVAAEATGTDVVLAVPAGVPTTVESSIILNIETAAAAGLVFGIIAAFLIEYWWRYKGVAPISARIIPLRKRKIRDQVSDHSLP